MDLWLFLKQSSPCNQIIVFFLTNFVIWSFSNSVEVRQWIMSWFLSRKLRHQLTSKPFIENCFINRKFYCCSLLDKNVSNISEYLFFYANENKIFLLSYLCFLSQDLNFHLNELLVQDEFSTAKPPIWCL